MEDKLIRGITENGNFKIAFVLYKNLIKEVKNIHNPSPLVMLALSRFIGCSLLLSTGLKEKEQYSINLSCNGQLKGISCDVTPAGIIRVYPKSTNAHYIDEYGRLNIKESIGKGLLTVTKWRKDQREPYNSNVELKYGDIAKDFTYYLTISEQIPSAIAIGDYIEKDGEISHCAGIMIQAMPDAADEEIGFLETTLQMQPSLSEMLLEGYTQEDIFDKVLGIMGFEKFAEIKPELKCNCSKHKIENALISLGNSELENIISDKKPLFINCEYCKKEYDFTIDELKTILINAKQ